MIQKIDTDIWHATHDFKVNGLPVSSRMTVVRLPGDRLWLHSPVSITETIRVELNELGTVEAIVAPSKVHHLFLAECMRTFPAAKVFGAPGLSGKRKDITGIEEINALHSANWSPSLEMILFEGIPYANETVWFHRASATLILTDLCQWWQGDIPWQSRLYARLTGVRSKMAVPETVRWLIRDRLSARRSANRILEWPFKRVIMAHNAIVEEDAHKLAADALAVI
jgi:hypothetical protein